MVDFIHKFRQVLSSNTPCNMQCPEKDKRRCFGDDHIFNKHVQEPLYRFAFSKCLNQPLYRFNDNLHTSLPIVVLAILVLSRSMMKIGKCMVLLFRRSIGLVDFKSKDHLFLQMNLPCHTITYTASVKDRDN